MCLTLLQLEVPEPHNGAEYTFFVPIPTENVSHDAVGDRDVHDAFVAELCSEEVVNSGTWIDTRGDASLRTHMCLLDRVCSCPVGESAFI